MDRRLTFLVLLIAVAVGIFLLTRHRAADRDEPGKGAANGMTVADGHLTVHYEADGRVFLGQRVVASLPSAMEDDPGAWDDALTEYKQAVLARYGRRHFGAGAYREGAVLTLSAPPDTPWRIVTSLTYPAGHPDLRIPTLRLVPTGRSAVTLTLPQDPGHTDAYAMDPPHVHVRANGCAVYDGGVIADLGMLYVDGERPPNVRLRCGSLEPRDLDGLTGAVRGAIERSEPWAGRAVALTWPTGSSTPFERMVDVLGRVLDASASPLYLSALDDEDAQGR